MRRRRQSSMRAFTGWRAPLFLLLLLSCLRPLSSSNTSLWQTIAVDPGPGFCSIGDTGSCELDLHSCSSGLSLDCAREQGPACRSVPEEEEGGNTAAGVGPVRASGEINDEYIVRFKEYRHASEFKRALREELGGDGRVWQWLERNNPASAFPTDFALLRIGRMQYDGVLQALRKLEFVKDISPQMRFTRSLTSEKSEDEYISRTGDDERHGKCEVSESEDKEEMLGSKPPGRLCTKLSFENEFKDVTTSLANLSLNYDRKLLVQVIHFRFAFESIFASFGRGRELPLNALDLYVRDIAQWLVQADMQLQILWSRTLYHSPLFVLSILSGSTLLTFTF